MQNIVINTEFNFRLKRLDFFFIPKPILNALPVMTTKNSWTELLEVTVDKADLWNISCTGCCERAHINIKKMDSKKGWERSMTNTISLGKR